MKRIEPVPTSANLFYTAIDKNNIADVENLIAQGFNINLLDRNGRTPLQFASCIGNLAIVRILLANKTDVNVSIPFHLLTPLHEASDNAHPDVVRELLAQGANVNAQDQYGNTALHFIAGQIKLKPEHLTCANLLVHTSTIDITCVNHYDITPLEHAKKWFAQLKDNPRKELIIIILHRIALKQILALFAAIKSENAKSPAHILEQDGQRVALRTIYEYLANQ